jgi:hypothetical protein
MYEEFLKWFNGRVTYDLIQMHSNKLVNNFFNVLEESGSVLQSYE